MIGTRTSNLLSLVALTVGVLIVAACGATKEAANRHILPPPRPTTVGVADNSSLERILVDSQGRTLHLFRADTTMRSTCFGACATAWPPVRAAGNPTAGNGATVSLVATTSRPGGAREVTHNGRPPTYGVGR